MLAYILATLLLFCVMGIGIAGTNYQEKHNKESAA
jgi:hypothetical protein